MSIDARDLYKRGLRQRRSGRGSPAFAGTPPSGRGTRQDTMRCGILFSATAAAVKSRVESQVRVQTNLRVQPYGCLVLPLFESSRSPICPCSPSGPVGTQQQQAPAEIARWLILGPSLYQCCMMGARLAFDCTPQCVFGWPLATQPIANAGRGIADPNPLAYRIPLWSKPLLAPPQLWHPKLRLHPQVCPARCGATPGQSYYYQATSNQQPPPSEPRLLNQLAPVTTPSRPSLRSVWPKLERGPPSFPPTTSPPPILTPSFSNKLLTAFIHSSSFLVLPLWFCTLLLFNQSILARRRNPPVIPSGTSSPHRQLASNCIVTCRIACISIVAATQSSPPCRPGKSPIVSAPCVSAAPPLPPSGLISSPSLWHPNPSLCCCSSQTQQAQVRKLT